MLFESIIPSELSPYAALALAVGGIVVAFAGKTLLKIVLMLISGGVSALLVYFVLSSWFSVGMTQTLTIAAIAFIAGAFMGWFIVKVAIAVLIGLVLGATAGLMLGFEENILALVIIIVTSMALSYLLAEKVIDAALTLLGALLVFFGVYYYEPSMIGKIIGATAALLVFVAALYHKARKKKKEEHEEK